MKRQYQYLLIILAIVSINILIYHFLYSYELKVPIHQSVAREQWIKNKEDAKEVIETEIENGAVILGENYYVVNRGNLINPIYYVEWWEYLGCHDEIRYLNRGVAYFLWGPEIAIFVFLIFIFSVSRERRHSEKSVSINS